MKILKILCEHLNPLALCLQETFLRQTDIHHFKHYNMYNCFGPGGDRATGGTAILVRQGIIHSHLQFNASLQATAVRITLSKTITLCSIYIPPSSAVSLHDMYVQPRLCDWAYKRSRATYRKEKGIVSRWSVSS